CIPDHGKPGELASNPYPFAPGDRIPADPPCEPVRARGCALHVPAAALVELTQVGKESIHGCIEVCRLFRNPLSQLLEITIHGVCLAHDSDIPTLELTCVPNVCEIETVNGSV